MSSNAPHILILSSWYPSEKHPFLGNFVQRQAQLLSKKYRVTVINLIRSKTITSNTISVEKDGEVTEIKAMYPQGNKLTRYTNRSRVFSQALEKIDDASLIIGHVLLPRGWMFLNAAKTLDCPWVWVEHGSYFRNDIQRRWSTRERILRRSAISSCETIVAVSDKLKEDLERYVGGKKIEVIGNHIDEALFVPKQKVPSEIKQFLHVSTLDKKTKNPIGILDACRLLKSESLPFRLTIVSDEDTSKLERYAAELELTEEVVFKGPQVWEDMPQFYYESDAFVLNSDYETFSIVLAEALATGTPIISTDVGIAREIPETAKISVKKDNPYSLSNAMKKFIEETATFDYHTITTMGQQYYAPRILEKWTQLIERYVR